MILTTTYNPSSIAMDKARRIAEEFDLRFVERQGLSLARLRARYGDDSILVITAEGEVKLAQAAAPTLFFHPSTAYLRVQRMSKGLGDFAMDLAGVRPGDRIMDCTAGLGADALVFAHAAGPNGRVSGVESQLGLYLLVREGLSHYQTPFKALREALTRVKMLHGDHLDILRGLADDSMDIVYFDPMFRQPMEESAAISLIRDLADHRGISGEAVREACRVARRTVLLKERRDSGEFERLGFTICEQRQSQIAYGVIKVDE